MKRPALTLLTWLFSASFVLAQNTGGNPLVPNGASGGGGGGGGVTSFSYSCPATGPLTGAVTLPNGIGEIPKTGAFQPSASQCGALFDSTGGAAATLPTIGVSAGDVQNPYFVMIKNADTAGNTMTVSGGGANINYNGATSSSITLNAGQSIAVVVESTNTFWQATSTSPAAFPTFHPGYISGDWYTTSPINQTGSGSAQLASSVYCSLQILNVSETFKSMGAYFSTGVASGNVSYAIFNSSHGRPSTLIDYAGPVAAPTAAGASTVSLHNTTDTLAAGNYFYCETQDNTTGVIVTLATSGSSAAFWLGVSAPTTSALTNSTGISCTAASTCGTGYAAWSAGAFTWASFSNPTWAVNETTRIPVIFMQAN